MGRSPCCSKEGLNRGAWTAMEDKILTEFIKLHGEGKWRNLPKRAGLKRCGKSCRLRWLNYLRPDIKRGNISTDEEDLIIRLHNLLGNRWSLIAGRLPGRTDNEIKNYWNTNIGKRFQVSPHSPNNPDTSNTKTTCRIKSPKPSKTTQEYQPRVVRTKATRCTKVVLFPPDQLHQEAPSTVSTDSKPVVVGDTVGSTALEDDHDHQANGSDQRSIPTLADDHDSFLSNFLNIDCLQHFSDCFDEEEDGNVMVNPCGNYKFGHVIEPQSNHSPPSDDDHRDHHQREANFLFSQDMLLGVDLPEASPIDPELDWLFQD